MHSHVLNRILTSASTALLIGALPVLGDLNPGTEIPNSSLKAVDGRMVQLHDTLNTVTVLHLWKCN